MCVCPSHKMTVLTIAALYSINNSCQEGSAVSAVHFIVKGVLPVVQDRVLQDVPLVA